MGNGQCQASGAFNLAVDGSEDTLHDESPSEGECLWIGIGIGFAVCLVVMVLMTMLIVFWRRYKKENLKVTVTVNDENDGVKLTDDQQLDAVPDTMTTIELN